MDKVTRQFMLQQWAEALRDHKESGLTVIEWCRLHNVSKYQYYCRQISLSLLKQRRRTTNATDMLIVFAFRDFQASAVSIAKKIKTSDTHVLYVFDRYVKMNGSH